MAVSMTRSAIRSCRRSTIVPSTEITARVAFSGRAKAASTFSAQITSSALGENTSLAIGDLARMDQGLAVHAEVAALLALGAEALPAG